MIYFLIALLSVAAGLIQATTGFGGPMILMLVLPYFFSMITAPALAASIAMGASIVLAWNFRKQIEWDIALFPTAVYTAFSMVAVQFAKKMDLDLLTLIFGIFLIILSAYYLFLSKRAPFQANWKSASICAAISGITVGLFGIGGPLMAIYFVSASRKKEGYVGNLQFMFASANVINMYLRIRNEIYTMDLIPFTLIGLVCIMVGKSIGLRILDKLDTERIKTMVYAFVGITGVVSVLQNLF